MLSYSQRDTRWRDKRIGNTNLSIGRFGCTISCIADLSTYFGDNLTPSEVNDNAKFLSDGRIIWSSLHLANFVFVKRTYFRNNTDFILALSDSNRAVILSVAGGSHWVVATGWQKEINDFKIADPWLGDWSNMSRYNGEINGAAFFKRK